MKEIHKKILPQYFIDVQNGEKTFELRKDEDNAQPGDTLILEEWDSGYTGRVCVKSVTYVLRDVPQLGLAEGYCILGLK